MLLDHFLHGLGGGFFLNAGIDHHAVLVNSDDGQAQDLLADSQTASLGGVQCAELQSGVLVSKGMNMGHQSSAGNAAVTIEIHNDLAGGLQNFGLKGILIDFENRVNQSP